jgi:hypothetical protein
MTTDPSGGPEAGPLLFARFALPPNQLGFCGGDEATSLLQHVEAGVVDDDLLRQCREFEGAYPYLRLIADEARMADPLDRAVVEGYWLGGPALERVGGEAFARELGSRFRSRTPRKEWSWLHGKAAAGALPHHSFHVLEVLPRIGMLRDGIPAAILPVLEQCLVRPARVVAVDGDSLHVDARRLVLVEGKLAFVTGSGAERVTWRADGAELLAAPRPGDRIGVHWGWACDRLSSGQERRLVAATTAAIARANETL